MLCTNFKTLNLNIDNLIKFCKISNILNQKNNVRQKGKFNEGLNVLKFLVKKFRITSILCYHFLCQKHTLKGYSTLSLFRGDKENIVKMRQNVED